jgi:hypothetical protein
MASFRSPSRSQYVSFPAAILPELQHHLDTYSLDGPDGLVFVNEHGQPWHRGNFNAAVRRREAREQIGVPNLHLHDLLTCMGHDSRAAALIYQHSNQVADEAIVTALDARLSKRNHGPLRMSWGRSRARPSRA